MGDTHFSGRVMEQGGVPAGEADPTAGKILYVNGTTWGTPAGSDSNEGTLDSPLQTIAAALDLCTSEHNDYIYVLDYWTGNSEAKPIVVDVDNVHIIGRTGCGFPWAMIYVSTDVAGFSITANHVEIANFHVYGGAAHGCIEIAATKKGIEIHHCYFGERTTGQDGIRVLTGLDASELFVHHCYFGTTLTRNGIRIINTATKGRFEDNIFRAVGAQGFYCVTGGARLGTILRNVFGLKADTKGHGITVNGADCVIDGNHAGIGVAAGSANPYLDTGANDWGLNYGKGITALAPATS